MNITLSDHDKELIRLVDEQVKQLRARNAADSVLVTTLIDFIPDLRCIVNEIDAKTLELFCQKYNHCSYFMQLINQT